MSSLQTRYVFGVNAGVTDNGAFADEDTIVYIGGHAVILYNRLDRYKHNL